MVTISGIFLDPDGSPVAGAVITFTQLKNTSDSFLRRDVIMTTAYDGSYSVQLYNGRYKVMAKYKNNSEAKLGEINVSDNTSPGTLNDYLLVGTADNTPSPLFLSIERMYFDILNELGKEPKKRYEDFDNIIERCTVAMLKLERPEVESLAVNLSVKENVTYDYTGSINGRCNISEPEKYRVAMYSYTTGEYFNGDANLNADGSFYFKRSWQGAKQFRLISKEDNNWITTLEFPLCIRSYWMAGEKDPDVVRVMKDRCYTYDQAVAALALMVQKHEDTERYVAGLCALVESDGGVKFYVNRLSGQSPRAYYRMGNAAWVFYALAFYLEKFPEGIHTVQAREKLTQGMTWLESFKVAIPGDLREGLYMGGRGKFQNGGSSFDPDYIAEWCALEHNVDIWFLFELMGRIGFYGYKEKADELAEKIISGFWMEDEGRFRQGVHPGKYDDAAALDQSSWGGVFIANIDMDMATKCHKYMSRFYYGTRETRGYTPYHPDYGYSGHQRGVWVEGTAGVVLLERRLGNDPRAADLIAALAPLCNEYGYRDSCDDPTYDTLPPWPSTTNTAWIILACKPDGFWLVDSPPMDYGLIEY